MRDEACKGLLEMAENMIQSLRESASQSVQSKSSQHRSRLNQTGEPCATHKSHNFQMETNVEYLSISFFLILRVQ